MDVLVLLFSSCAIETALYHSRVIKIPLCKCKLSVTGCGHISYSWPGEARILPKARYFFEEIENYVITTFFHANAVSVNTNCKVGMLQLTTRGPVSTFYCPQQTQFFQLNAFTALTHIHQYQPSHKGVSGVSGASERT